MDSWRQKSGQMMKQNEEWTSEEVGKLRNQLDELAAELEERLREYRRLQQELEEQNKARAQFIATLAHELRTPLTPVLGSARLLIEQFRPEPGSLQDRLIRSIVRGAESLESRLSDLLNLAQFQAGAFFLEIAPMDVKDLLNDLASQFQPLAKSKGQTFTLNLPRKLHLVNADRRRIDQVVMNLLGNAVKFTPEGGSILLRAMAHPSDNLRTIPGVGEHTAPGFLSAVGDPTRFRSQSAFANWEGVVPGARQSSNVEAKGLRMTKAGPAIMRMALYQAGDIGRRWDSQLAAVYYREMVYHGKNHKQAMGVVMSHLGARVLAVLKEDRPYELRDPEGKLISKDEAKKLILSKYHVSEDIRQERRRHKPVKVRRNDQEMTTYRTNEAANAPQPVEVMAISRK